MCQLWILRSRYRDTQFCKHDESDDERASFMLEFFIHFVKHLSVKSEIADCILSRPVSFSTNCFMSFCSAALRESILILTEERDRGEGA